MRMNKKYPAILNHINNIQLCTRMDTAALHLGRSYCHAIIICWS